jgi:tetratricopeptide (TPR) repeat protein
VPQAAAKDPRVSSHIGDSALLGFVSGDGGPSETEAIERHLAVCAPCRGALEEIRDIDRAIQALRPDGELERVLATPRPVDPFASRPLRYWRAARSASLPSDVVIRSRNARTLQAKIMALQPEEVPRAVSVLDLSDTGVRFGLLYVLQEAGRRVGEGIERASALANETIRLLRSNRLFGDLNAGAPLLMLWGQAHILAGQCLLWSTDFTKAGVHFRLAYRAFGRLGDETGLAIVELNEAQRRALTHGGKEALVLARRARETFVDLTLEDLEARALVAEGLAYFDLERQEEAVARYREALPIFERCELWGNWVGALSSLATSLTRLGRFDEARREYARALRRFSAKEHRAWRGFLLDGLAEVHFRAGKYREAAVSYGRAARGYVESGLGAHALLISAAEVESWMKAGYLERARHRLELLRTEVANATQLDETVLEDLRQALETVTLTEKDLALCRQQLKSALGSRLLS